MHGAKDLTPELERAALHALAGEWRDLNWQLFKDRMRPPIFELSDGRQTLGQWLGGSRTMRMSRHLLCEAPWGAVIEVLKHEMAHQYVQEWLHIEDEPPHGPTFRHICKEREIDAAPEGTPKPASDVDVTVTRKVAKLLALSGSSNRNEAETAMKAARRLILQHNLQAIASSETRDYEYRHLHPSLLRVFDHHRILARILEEHFLVTVLWVPIFEIARGKRAQVIEICGTRSNLEIAEYVHAFLLGTGDRLWTDYRRSHTKSGTKHQFLSGLMRGFDEKLGVQTNEEAQRGLVLAKEDALVQYMRRRYPKLRSVRRAAPKKTRSFDAGQVAGRGLVLHKAVEAAPVTRGRALPAPHKN